MNADLSYSYSTSLIETDIKKFSTRPFKKQVQRFI